MYFHEMAFRHQKITQLSSFVHHHPFGPPAVQQDDSQDEAPPPRTPIYMGRSRSQDVGLYRPPQVQPPHSDDSSPPPLPPSSAQPPPPPPQTSSFRFAENGSPWNPTAPTGTYINMIIVVPYVLTCNIHHLWDYDICELKNSLSYDISTIENS